MLLMVLRRCMKSVLDLLVNHNLYPQGMLWAIYRGLEYGIRDISKVGLLMDEKKKTMLRHQPQQL